MSHHYGTIAQLGEHLPYKQGVTGSSPVSPTIRGLVVQLVRMPACHAGGRGFESLPGRQFNTLCWCGSTVEQLTCNQQVVGSIPITSSNVEDFPSGQRGQTVNLLALLSVVRIHHPPPKKKYADVAELADALDLGSSAFGVGVRLPSSAPLSI